MQKEIQEHKFTGFFIDSEKKPFYDPSKEVIDKFNLTLIDEDKWYDIARELKYPNLSQSQIEASKRAERDEFLAATDKMMLIDYSINNVALSDAQRAKLIEIRNAFRTWTENEKWYESSLPDMPLWLMNEAVSNGWTPPRDYYPSELDDLV